MKIKYLIMIFLLSGIVGFTAAANAEDLINADVLKKHFTDKANFKTWYAGLNQDDKNQVLAGAVVLCQPEFTQLALAGGGNINTEVFVVRQQMHTHKYGDRYDFLIYTQNSMEDILNDAENRPAGVKTMHKLGDHHAMAMPFGGTTSAKVSLLTEAISECKGEPRKQLVQLLLKNGVNVNSINDKGENAFQKALQQMEFAKDDPAERDAPEVFDLLMQHLPKNGLNTEISSALIMDAYIHKKQDLLDLYKEKKLRLSIKSKSAEAAFASVPQISAGLFGILEDNENKANDVYNLFVEMLNLGINVNARDRFGDTALINMFGNEILVNKMNPKSAVLLIEKGADVNMRNRLGRTALFYAVRNQDLDAVKLLLKYNADATIVDNEGKSVFSAINPNQTEPSNPEIYKLLIEHGADVKLLNKDPDSAFKIAKIFGNAKTLNLLLDNGLDANLHNDVGYTLLMEAVCATPRSYDGDDNVDDIEMVQTILAHGANINAQVNEKADIGVGETALSKAEQCYHKKVADFLLKAGADASLKPVPNRNARRNFPSFPPDSPYAENLAAVRDAIY